MPPAWQRVVPYRLRRAEALGRSFIRFATCNFTNYSSVLTPTYFYGIAPTVLQSRRYRRPPKVVGARIEVRRLPDDRGARLERVALQRLRGHRPRCEGPSFVRSGVVLRMALGTAGGPSVQRQAPPTRWHLGGADPELLLRRSTRSPRSRACR